ncbi:hybrid sensor histidine kinase/response regulator [Hymenobacter metallilatus]|uniref:Sensory/regulatory protein RpfC n=1 Tax=Hymenobacter metallilatus TaxID=2493666 RepID=A0A3R9N0G9_9BACT|nr:hybrid sensor histidine kinase/response regulator [Hymenobacter metallilatus]RSK35357.1 hybrid sensor histidine kinase/response regulator [Hymenobacter metallilatus]
MIRHLLLLFCLLTHFAVAQPLPQRQFLKQFGAAEGLPQPFIYALAQDCTGYLWIGTGEGLVRFDGTTFQTFTTREGLAEDFVTRLSLDAGTGQLWVSHYQGGVSVSQGSGFRRATAADGKQIRVKGLPTVDTAAIGRFRRRFHPALPPDAAINQILRDAEGTYWIGTTGLGLWRLTDAHLSFSPTAARLTALAGRGALIAAGTADGQLGRLLPTPNGLTLHFHSELQSGSATALLPVSDWSLAGTDGKGVHPFVSVATDTDPPDLTHLPADLHVTTLTLDKANSNFFLGSRSFWVGTIGEGAFHVTGRQVRHYTTANGLLQNDVYAILPDRQGRVWFATHGTGLAVLENGRFRVHRLVPGGVDATTLTQDAAGRVWIGTEGDGLFCFANGRFRQFTTQNSGLASNYCYGLQPTPTGLVVQHRNDLSLGRGMQFTAISTPNNPIIRDLLPNVAAPLPPADSAVLLASRTGLVRVKLSGLHITAAAPATFTAVEVDGIRQPAGPLPELSARPHRVTWFFRVASLGPAGTWQYQYRLRGFQENWSRPATTGEADFPRLDAGRYTLEVRARRGSEGTWSKPITSRFSIATPFWRTWWFSALALLAAGAGVYAFTRARTATLRRQKLQLETTVRERTTELRHQKAEIEQINADLVMARDAAEASRKAKAQFLANMSHEIRTPMNAVIGLTHLLRNTPVSGEQSEYLQAIQSSSNNLLVIINDILDSSKIEAGKLTLEQAPFRLPELVGRVARMFQFATEAKGLTLHTEVAPDVPAAILGDSVRLNQVLVNLVGNAVKFTTTGGVTLRLSVQPAADNAPAMLRFGVTDTGIGIAADKLDAIFEDFSQANASTTRQFGGTGLGLSIARNLVQLHGGRLWVESQEGRGSTFWFEVPCQPADAALVRTEASGALLPFSPPLRVLVAEDNDLNQLVARKTLEAWNVQVTIAANGRLAVEAARQQEFDAVLLDIQMPEMDGYEAARQLRSLFPDAARLPLIGLTASALPEDRVLALEAGMNDTLAKPFDPAVLYARLAHFTGRALPPATPATPAPALPPATGPQPPHQPATSSPADTPLQPDWSLLEELAGGNEAFVQQIVRTFLEQAPPLVEQLQQATGAELGQVAHKLKGQVAYFGLVPLTDQLEYLEQQSKSTIPANSLFESVQFIDNQLFTIYPILLSRLTEAEHKL